MIRVAVAAVLLLALATPVPAARATSAATLDADSIVTAGFQTAEIAAPGEIRVGIVRTQAAAGTKDYISGNPLNSFYDARVDYVRNFLQSEGFVVAEVNDATLASLSALKQFDVLVFPRTLATTSAQRTAIRAFASEGGGLVGSFGLSRWDASSSYTHGYLPFLGMHGHPGVYTWPPSSDALKPWEWGSISEIYNVKFRNDPLMYGPYKLDPSNSHWIMQNGFSSSASRLMVAKKSDYNEVSYTMSGARNVTPLFRYNTMGNGSTADDAETGHLAGWTAEYYFGRMVYFGFQMHDLIAGGTYADAPTVTVARKVLSNSVRWAGSPGSYTHMRKAVGLSGKAWYTRETLYVDETVKNTGNVSLRGPLRIQVRNPSGAIVYTGQAYNNQTPLPPSGSYTHKSYQIPLKNPQSGTWRIVMSYQYYDYFHNGWVGANRTVFIESNGSAMWGSRMGAQTFVGSGNQPVIGTRVAGTSRYDTSVRLSQRGWPSGVGESRTVVLATGTGYADALAAAPLAGVLDAPVLLVPRNGLTSDIVAELRRLFSSRTSGTLLVVGGESAVSGGVVSEAAAALAAAGVVDVTVDRVAGKDRYGTARAIAGRVGVPAQGPFAGTAFVVSGQNYPDALAIGALASAEGVPILPVRATSVPTEIAQAFGTLGVEHTTIVGGTRAVGASVESWLESQGHRTPGIPDGAMHVDTRLAGGSRYETALLAGSFAVTLADLDDSRIYFATGRNWPDALALGPVAGRERTTVVLLHGAEIGGSVPVADYLMARRSDPPVSTFVGGNSAISDYVRGQVRIALGQ